MDFNLTNYNKYITINGISKELRSWDNFVSYNIHEAKVVKPNKCQLIHLVNWTIKVFHKDFKRVMDPNAQGFIKETEVGV